MSTTEIILNMLAETSTKDISQASKPETFEENIEVARRGGNVAGIAKQALEAETGARYHFPKRGAIKRRCNGHD